MAGKPQVTQAHEGSTTEKGKMNTHASEFTLGPKAKLHQDRAIEKLDNHKQNGVAAMKPFTVADLADELLWLEVKKCWHPTKRKDSRGGERAAHGFSFTDPHKGYVSDGDANEFLEYWIQKSRRLLPDKAEWTRLVPGFETRLSQHGFRVKAKFERQPVVVEPATPAPGATQTAAVEVGVGQVEQATLDRLLAQAELQAKAEKQVQDELFAKMLADARKRYGVV